MSIKISKRRMNGMKLLQNRAPQKINLGTMYWFMRAIIPRMLLNKIWKLMTCWKPSTTQWWNTSFPSSIMGGMFALTRITSQETQTHAVGQSTHIMNAWERDGRPLRHNSASDQSILSVSFLHRRHLDLLPVRQRTALTGHPDNFAEQPIDPTEAFKYYNYNKQIPSFCKTGDRSFLAW